MKKNKTLFSSLLILLFTSYFVSGQTIAYPLEDAVKYNDVNTNFATKHKILQSYSSDLINLSTIRGNNFLNLTNIGTEGSYVAQIVGPTGDAQVNGGSPLGAPLINALTDVIVIRFKEELTLSFINSFRKKLEANTYLADLFPNAKLILMNGDPFNYKVWLSSFRGALDNDLRLLPDNLPKLIETIKTDPTVGLLPAQITAIDTFMAAYVPALRLSKTPEKSYLCVTQLLDNLHSIIYSNPKINAGILITDLLTKELGNGSYSDWATNTMLSNLSKYETCKTFIGLTIEKNATVLQGTVITIYGIPTNLYDYLRTLPVNRINEVVQFTKNLTSKTLEIYASINDLKKINVKVTYENYIPLINKSLETLKLLTDTNNFNSIIPISSAELQEISKQIDNIQSCVTYASSINSYIATKDYAKIVVTSIAFVEKQITQNNLSNSGAMKEFVKYVDLATSIASAETSDQIVAAIEGAALPTQSYRLKRNSYFSISLNSYAGIFAGNEILQNSDAKNRTAGVVGFTAPVGVAFNWAINKKSSPTALGKYPGKTTLNGANIASRSDYFSGQSISIFASIVDVGALAVYRLTGDETPANNINWQNIFAPGLHLIWGIGDTPLSMGASVQYGPELRKVSSKDGVIFPTIESRAWRYGLSLTVDIPLFSLYAKTEKVD